VRPVLRISTDATHRGDIIGIAAVLSGRDIRPLFMDVIGPEHGDNMAAEWLALAEAMRIADKANMPGVIHFLADASGLAKMARKDPRTKDYLERHPLWEVKHIPRARNTAAHTMASQAVKCWRAGSEGRWTMTDGEIERIDLTPEAVVP
jgi:hypothetical protein